MTDDTESEKGAEMETATIDRLVPELSQITTATTRKELELMQARDDAYRAAFIERQRADRLERELANALKQRDHFEQQRGELASRLRDAPSHRGCGGCDMPVNDCVCDVT